MGFMLVTLNELGITPTIPWSEIYSRSDFWSVEKFKLLLDKFHNIATTFGKSHLRDIDGREIYLSTV